LRKNCELGQGLSNNLQLYLFQLENIQVVEYESIMSKVINLKCVYKLWKKCKPFSISADSPKYMSHIIIIIQQNIKITFFIIS